MASIASWVNNAACAGTDPEMWFPDRWNSKTLRPLKDICRQCPVIIQCLEFAVEDDLGYGIFGGATPNARTVIRSRKGYIIPRTVSDGDDCGTSAGYCRHRRQGTKACEPCLAAERRRVTANREARLARLLKEQEEQES